MSDQPEALRLADALDNLYVYGLPGCEAAAELHRLHAENERLRQINQSHEMKLSVRGYEIQIADLEAQRDALKAERDALQNTKHYEAPRGFVLNPDYLVPELQAERDAAVEKLTAVSDALDYLHGGTPAMAVQLSSLRAERDAAVAALEMIAGVRPCLDNLMSDKDIARAAIDAARGEK